MTCSFHVFEPPPLLLRRGPASVFRHCLRLIAPSHRILNSIAAYPDRSRGEAICRGTRGNGITIFLWLAKWIGIGFHVTNAAAIDSKQSLPLQTRVPTTAAKTTSISNEDVSVPLDSAIQHPYGFLIGKGVMDFKGIFRICVAL